MPLHLNRNAPDDFNTALEEDMTGNRSNQYLMSTSGENDCFL